MGDIEAKQAAFEGWAIVEMMGHRVVSSQGVDAAPVQKRPTIPRTIRREDGGGA